MISKTAHFAILNPPLVSIHCFLWILHRYLYGYIDTKYYAIVRVKAQHSTSLFPLSITTTGSGVTGTVFKTDEIVAAVRQTVAHKQVFPRFYSIAQ